jgi:hypothetical protein
MLALATASTSERRASSSPDKRFGAGLTLPPPWRAAVKRLQNAVIRRVWPPPRTFASYWDATGTGVQISGRP